MDTALHGTLAAQRRAFLSELPVSASARKDRLKRLIAMVAKNANGFADALDADFGGRSHDQSLGAAIASSITSARHAIASLDKWMKPEKRKLPFPLRLMGAQARVEWQPKGTMIWRACPGRSNVLC